MDSSSKANRVARDKKVGTTVMGDDKIEQIIDKYRGKPGSLISALMDIQHENHWLPREALRRVAEALDVPFSRVMQVATVYNTFSLTPRGRHEVHVCTGLSCHLRGAARLLETVERLIGIKAGETDNELRFQPGDWELPRQLQSRTGDHRRRNASRQNDPRRGGRRAENL